ncbi:hypothetical protein PHLCEN_2v12704 [Hermanssonia centrifuga]|uniref:Uncharacterized protein n=1 Tax=Hermanssonia centrifuga TaxID=98765 RepID=A0A2R6NGC5_9APHY|nr:hypothetical protein PHLCEN_2v12704 [Hermanssonia centrifuga]
MQINSSSSPYEAEDDFFTHTRAQDDSSLPLSKRSDPGYVSDSAGRPRGQSESVVRLSS